jgi:hypothetical protein
VGASEAEECQIWYVNDLEYNVAALIRRLIFWLDFWTSCEQCYSLGLIWYVTAFYHSTLPPLIYHSDFSALEIQFLDVLRAATAAHGLHAQP